MKLAERCWLTGLCLGLLLVSLAPLANAQTIKGKVVKVLDGDTIELLTPEHERVRVRLAGIDAPEKGQAFGSRAREHMSQLCAGVEAEAYPTATDRYGRTVAQVKCSGLDADQAMIGAGLAWVYRQYAPAIRPQYWPLYELEVQARSQGIGLWSAPNPTPPWTWRRARREKR